MLQITALVNQEAPDFSLPKPLNRVDGKTRPPLREREKRLGRHGVTGRPARRGRTTKPMISSNYRVKAGSAGEDGP
jgi:hypothetical protein